MIQQGSSMALAGKEMVFLENTHRWLEAMHAAMDDCWWKWHLGQATLHGPEDLMCLVLQRCEEIIAAVDGVMYHPAP